MKKILMSMICLFGLLSISENSSAAENWTWDTSSDKWQIEVSLKGESDNLCHLVDSVLIDPDKHEIIILYRGKNRGIHYPCQKIKNIKFYGSNGIHHEYTFH